MSWYGRAFLDASIGNVLRRLCAEKVAIEVDPLRSKKGAKDVERNVEQLVYWCGEFWNQIYSVRNECPKYVFRLSESMRLLNLRIASFADSSKRSAHSLNSALSKAMLQLSTVTFPSKVYQLSASCGSSFLRSSIPIFLDYTQVCQYCLMRTGGWLTPDYTRIAT